VNFFKKKAQTTEVKEGVISEEFLKAALNTNIRNPVLAMITNEGGYKYLASDGWNIYFEYKIKSEEGSNTLHFDLKNLKQIVDEYNSVIIEGG
jgi:hypothetical protein